MITISEDDRNYMECPIRELTPLDKEYPDRLRDISDKPRVIYVKGNLPRDDAPSVAIIGARDGTEYGKSTARAFGRALAMQGVSVISGMAYGIDSAAQWGAIDAEKPTFAVFGCGLNVCYPPSNFELYKKIIKYGGCAISEHPLDTQPIGRYFASRNRIIAGLADCLLVMEAKERSGTSITVGDALKQGKQVFALPGRISDRLSNGANKLIRDGAEILTSVEDVMEYLHLTYKKEYVVMDRDTSKLSDEQRKVFKALSSESIHIDEIIKKTHVEITELLCCLTDLEILGYIEMPKAGYYRVKSGIG